VRQNPIQRTVSLFICVCNALCTIVAHNIAQNRPDSFPPYPPDDHHSSHDVYLREGGGLRAQRSVSSMASLYLYLFLHEKLTEGNKFLTVVVYKEMYVVIRRSHVQSTYSELEADGAG